MRNIKIIDLGSTDHRWHQATDQLVGTDVYGTANDATNDWSVAFDETEFDQFLFTTSDCNKWLIAEKDQVLGWYANEDREIIRSSTSSEPYTAKWYRRQNNLEDPWISLNDHMASIESVVFEDSDYLLDYDVGMHGGMTYDDGVWTLP